MNNKLRTAWTVAGVLGVLLIIVTSLYVTERGLFTLDADDLERSRDQIAEVCGSAEELKSPACQDALDDLARLLGRFEKKLQNDQVKEAEGGAEATVELGQ